jgi:hypothetical protein
VADSGSENTAGLFFLVSSHTAKDPLSFFLSCFSSPPPLPLFLPSHPIHALAPPVRARHAAIHARSSDLLAATDPAAGTAAAPPAEAAAGEAAEPP